MVISNLISKHPEGPLTPQGCVCDVGMGLVEVGGNDYRGCCDLVFEVKFEKTVSRFDITVFEVKPSYRKFLIGTCGFTSILMRHTAASVGSSGSGILLKYSPVDETKIFTGVLD